MDEFAETDPEAIHYDVVNHQLIEDRPPCPHCGVGGPALVENWHEQVEGYECHTCGHRWEVA